MLFINPNQIVLACCGMGETPTQTKSQDQGTGLGTAIGGLITGITYITSSIITGVATVKAYEDRDKQFKKDLESLKKQWDAEREAKVSDALTAIEQARSGAAAGAVNPLLVLGLLAGLAAVYKFA